MVVPTSSDVRAALPQFGWAERGYAAGSPDPLDSLVEEAVSYVTVVTGRPIDGTMPVILEPIARRAITLRTAQDVLLSDDAYVETVNDDAIVSFSIGPYSETRAQNKGWHGQAEAPFGGSLNPWAPLNQALWLLLTDAQRDYWRALLSGVNPPAFGLQEMDWTNGRSGRIGLLGWTQPAPTIDIPDPTY